MGDRILSFDSHVEIKEDGSMTVTEVVTVNVGPRNMSKIRHGIYRDFPTKYKTNIGTVRVDFNVVSVVRDGKREDFRLESLVNGYRVYMGLKESLVEEGLHTYEFTYTTSGQLGYFKNHDELYWNVSGDGWVFPKDSISCLVTLPGDVDESQLSLEAFTGSKGSKGKDFDADVVNGTVHFHSTKEMRGNEELTIVVMFPKGVVWPETKSEKLERAMNNFAQSIIAFIGVASLSCYLWCYVSTAIKHPPKGIARYRSKPPDGISPAAARFLVKKGFDNRCLASAVVNLCVKGWSILNMEQKHGRLQSTGGLKYTLRCSNRVGEKI